MALLKKKAPTEPLSKDFLDKIDYGWQNLQKTAPGRDEAWEFFRDNHFVYVNNGKLSFISGGSIGLRVGDKPAQVSRQSRNLIFDVVRSAASAAVSVVPSYQIIPSSVDPSDASAAELAKKVMLYGYQAWNLRQMTIDAVIHALVGGEAFVWAYFDNSIGPFVADEQGSVGTGDVRARVFGGNSCYWTPGLQFYEAPYHCVELATDPAAVKAMPGFLGGDLTPDAESRAGGGRRKDKAKLLKVTHYLERPCPDYPEGRWVTIAKKRRIMDDRPYPGTGESPVLRPLVYASDPDNDRALGLVPQLIDPQRTVDDAENKAIEWKNRMLNPQYVVAPGLLKKQRITNVAGHVYEVPNPNENFKVLETPPIPQGLFEMGDRARNDLLRIAGQQDIPEGVEAAKAIQTLLEKNRASNAMFFGNLAEMHSNVAHDCLEQVQANYTEERLITFRGDFGWESIADFKGAQLRNQTDVRVFADSIEPQTKQSRDQRIMTYAQIGAITPTEAMTAIETGATEGLIRSFAQDEARVGRIIQRLKQGPEALGAMPMLPTGRMAQIPGPPDPMTGQPTMADGDQPEMAPAWMPRYSDNLGIFRATFEDWLKGEEYERQPPDVQAAANEIYGGILKLQAQKDQEAAQAQMEQAQGLGLDNAAKPSVKPMPSLPGLNGDTA